jgi:hypothetical protein
LPYDNQHGSNLLRSGTAVLAFIIVGATGIASAKTAPPLVMLSSTIEF